MIIPIYYIYKHTSQSTGKSYIGITNNLRERWNTHFRCARNGSPKHFHRAIRKYGELDWYSTILCMTKNESDGYWLEKYFINEFNTQKKGYNMTEGGKVPPAMKGHLHPLYGKQRTDDEKRKISINHADMVGSNNSNAKHFWLKSPEGKVFNTYGSLKLFCKNHNLSYSTVVRQLCYGIRPKFGSFSGWEIGRGIYSS